MERCLPLLIWAFLGISVSTPGIAQISPDEEGIRRVITEMTEGFNRHDAKAASRMYTADADFVTVRGERAKGAGALERQLAAIFTTRAKEATQKTLGVTVRFIAPDVAVAHVTNELSGIVRPDDQRLPPHTEISIRVFVKSDGAWKVAAFHNTIVAPF